MKPGRKYKFPLYFILFAISLYSVSHWLDPLLGLATGSTSGIKDGILAKLLPTITGGAIPALKGAESETQLVSVDQLLQNVNSLTTPDAGPSDRALQAERDDWSALLSATSGAPSSRVGRTSSGRGNDGGARVIRKVGSGASESRPIEMRSLDTSTLDEETLRTLSESAVALHAQGRLEEAITAYRRAIRESPDDAGLHLNLAIALYQSEQYRDAWLEVHAARRLGRSEPAPFTSALSAKLPDPDDS